MAGSLAERLRVARGKLFVGRETERALFCEAIESPQLPFCVLYIYGLGGVGKTTLLGNLNASCAEK